MSDTMDLRNTELNLTSKIVTSDSSQIVVGSQVPAGMKRWYTFLQFDTATVNRASDCGLYLASVNVSNPTRASIVAVANRKLFIPVEGTQLSRSSRKRPIMVPEGGPNPSAPIFSIASGNYLAAYASKTTANLTLQSFDE